MKQQIANSKTDPMGHAIYDYHTKGEAAKLRVLSSMFDEDEIPVATLFRSFEEMPKIEQRALMEAKGRILDVGAGAGCHSLALQAMNKDVTALDISQLSVQTMQERGVKKVLQQDFFDESMVGGYDTLLMLMNGSGIIGSLDNMPQFFAQASRLLAPEGVILLDSCDLRYVFEDEDGTFDSSEFDHYYGEIDYQMRYKGIRGSKFDWLYVDFLTLAKVASENGFSASLVEQGENYTYLAMLKRS